MKKIILLAALLYPAISWAHPNHLGAQGFAEGLFHPLTGIDHALAMVAVGVLASQKANLWKFPLTFLAFMIIGGLVGYMGIAVPWVEMGILLSVLVLGLWMAFPNILPSACLFVALMAFALCHGFAHGAEILPGRPLYAYIVGFIVATASLHIAGIALAKMLLPKQSWIVRFSGLSMALCTYWL